MPLPIYVELAGYPVGRLPYVADEALLHCFALQGQRPLLQQLCQRMLSAPTKGAFSFHAATSVVLLTALYVPRMRSGDPVDATKGFVRESDVGFWILTIGGSATAPWTWKPRWFPVHMFVDCGPAIAGGREAFGFPKISAQIERAGQADDEAGVTVKTLRVEAFGPTNEATYSELFSITTTATAPTAAAALPPALLAALIAFRDAIGQGAVTMFPSILLGQLMPPLAMSMPMIFLKQFRDIAVPGAACYQAITEAKAETSNVHSGGGFAGAQRATLVTTASHPIKELLGLTDNQAVMSAFWLKQDFKQGFGTVLWQAP